MGWLGDCRGFVVSLDAVISAFIVISVLGYAMYVLNESSSMHYSGDRLMLTGYDTLKLLYVRGVLQSMNESQINEELSEVLPDNYGMRLRVESYVDAGDALVLEEELFAGDMYGDEVFRTHGGCTFLTFTDDNIDKYAFAEFWIWLD